MQWIVLVKALRYIVLVFLCLALLFAAPCSCNALLCLGGNQQDQGLLAQHPVRQHFDENDTSSVTVVAATKAYVSPVVFRGTLSSVLVQRDGTVRATFNVDKLVKAPDDWRASSLGSGHLEVLYLQRPVTGHPCAFEVNEGNLKLGSSYVVFGRYVDESSAAVSATGFPIPYQKKTFRAIRRVVCKGCAKPPRIQGLRSIRIPEKKRVRLQCHVSGNPIPWVTWYKDGRPINGKGRVRVRTKRRTSRLVIRQSRLRDRGVYECRAVNIVQGTPVSAKALVAVTKRQRTTKRPRPTTTTTTAAPTTEATTIWPIGRCPNSEFCLNGGTCIFFMDVKEYVCQCADGFVGHRCDFKDVQSSVGGVKNYSSREAIP